MSDSVLACLILVGIGVFVVGNFMGAKPKPSELKIEELRLAARSANLSPKIIAMPFWLIPNFKMLPNTQITKHSQATTVTQYTLVDDTWQLPQSCYRAYHGRWQFIDIDDNNQNNKNNCKLLDGKTIELGEITSFVVGVAFKSNSVILLWHDDKFAKQSTIPTTTDNNESLKHWQDFVNDLKNKLSNLPYSS